MAQQPPPAHGVARTTLKPPQTHVGGGKWYVQIFLGLGGTTVATKQPQAGWNKEFNSLYLISLSI